MHSFEGLRCKMHGGDATTAEQVWSDRQREAQPSASRLMSHGTPQPSCSILGLPSLAVSESAQSDTRMQGTVRVCRTLPLLLAGVPKAV